MSETTTRAEPAAIIGDSRGPDWRVLVLAPSGCVGAGIGRALSQAGLDAEHWEDVDRLCAEISRGAAAVLLAEEALLGDARPQLAAALAEQPAWSDLPLLVMISPRREEGDGWQAVQGLEGTAHWILLERPLHAATLVSAVRVALESRRRQYHIRDELAAGRRAEEEIRRLASFPEENPNPVVRLGLDGRLLYANAEGRRTMEAMGSELDKSVPRPLLDLMADAAAQERPVEAEVAVEPERTFWFCATRPPGQHYVNLYGRDVTARKQAEQLLREARDGLEIAVQERTAELLRANQRLKEENEERVRTEQSLRLEEARLDALLRLSQISGESVAEIGGFALEQGIALTRSQIGFVGFLSEDEAVFTLHAVSRNVVKECGVTGDPVQWHVAGAGIWADAIRERRTLFVNDYGAPHPGKKGFPTGHPQVKRFMIVPVFDGERIVAVAGVGNKASDYDKSDERQIVLLLGGMWNQVQRDVSRQALQEAHDELERRVEQRTAELAATTAALQDEIAERKEVEETLRRSREDLTRAQAVGQSGSWRLDVRRNVLRWSDENHRIFGIPKGTPMTYETFLETVHADDRQYVDARWNAALRGEPYDIEHRIVVDGAVKWVREKAYLEFNEEGELQGGFGITQDITDRKQAQEALQTLNETLEQRVTERTAMAERRARDLRRLAAELSEAEHRERTRLARVLHDDLQQLLLAVKLRVSALVGTDPSQLGRRIDQLDELVGECMSASRNLTQELSPPIIQRGSLADVVEWLGHWFAEKHGLAVAVDAQNELPAAPEHLRVFVFQAVRELLLNAVKHSGSMEARVMLSSQDGNLTVQVEDGGNAFDPQTVEDRLERPEGFGLFNIRERLEALLGRLEIQSTPQGGGCFRLMVPISEQAEGLLEDVEPQRVKMAASRARKSRAQGAVVRLLVVDDHAVVREGLVGLLDRQADFDVVGEAADGEEAVERAEAMQPDAILMDVDMPNLNGIEATRRLKKQYPEIIVIGLSLHEERGFARAMTDAGADAYVSKHAPAKEVLEAVRRACHDHADSE